MATTCPKCGASSATDDYCDQCGARLGEPPAAAQPPVAVTPPTDPAPSSRCPACDHPVDAGASFCESCGCDLATGAVPEPVRSLPPPEPSVATPVVAWELVVGVDAERWHRHADLHGTDPPAADVVIPLVTSLVSVGRTSRSRGTTPDVDAAALVGDPAVSHEHCVFTREASGRWSVRDAGSQNGTRMAGSELAGPTVVGDGAVVEIGAWTRLTLRSHG